MSGEPVGSTSDESLKLFIDGQWKESESRKTRDATNPATGDVIGRLPVGTRDDIERAVASAREHQPTLASKTPFERAEICHEIADVIERNAEELASWLTRDQGKPFGEAKGEVAACAHEFTNAAEDIVNMETEVIPSQDADKEIKTLREPHGVYGVITPWNFPVNIPAEYLAPGLVTGNAIVWVPAPSTSVVGVKLMELIAETSLPDGCLNLVTGPGEVVGNELVVNEGVDAIAFTGSPETGEEIASEAGLKPTLLELGGNGPVIVLDDADLDAAAEGAAMGCFGNAGQTCSASERILVHEDVAEGFTNRLAEHAASLQIGNPTEEETDMGPLNNDAVAAKMDRHVEDAVEKGARLVTGGQRAPNQPTDRFYEPTVLAGVTSEMVVNEEETFGPIAPVIEFSEYDEAIELANDIGLGLTSAVFTSDLKLSRYFSSNLETGIVNVNDSSTYWEIHTPFGGYTGKQSGNGSRLGGKYTIEEMTQLKTVVTDYENVDSPM
jgi:succinate-semialdehyde dehydrogenase/glutarate-semialdehyde dehydrogenase